jgi:hypothetical protein
MSKIEIIIPIGLSESAEKSLIAKKLLSDKFFLVGTTKQIEGNIVKDSQIEIIVKRESTAKSKIMMQCYCDTLFEKSIGKILYVNYGGIKKQKRFCSDRCRQNIIDLCGDRCSIKPSKLKPIILF